ncbi:MAG TPA: BlaI/MecI/CopY family transcriptional regulator [Bryobacteraceae bacterium]|jgi:predicted transcriptional regulator|nr:BlaI/MecI/CopY family transcriptional regulator [Bryobacteraceae bacterium]
MSSAKPALTGQELEIMKVVWTLESATVRQVYETLLKKRHIAYTTVMTMMNILEQKGFLKKHQEERAYVYSPAQPQKQVVGSMVRDFVNRVFNGAAEPLLLHLVEDRKLTEKDLDEIREIIRKQPGRRQK